VRGTAKVVFPLVFFSLNCGSLINELERIKNKALGVAPPAAATGPVVLYTIPADGTVSAPVQSYVDVVFDQPIDAASAAGPTNSGCTGSAQASFDNFTECGGVPSVSGNTIRISSNGSMPQGATIKVQTTAAIRGTNGLAATAYTSPLGVSFASPCGQNCFHSDSAPLPFITGNGSHSFVIPSGAKAGWILIVHGGGSGSTYYNPQTNQTMSGPTLCAGIANGSHSFEVKTLGGLRSGKVITFAGGGSANACTFDNNTETFTSGPVLGGATPNVGSMIIPVLSGANTGQYLLIVGNGTLAYLYDVGMDSFTVTPSVGVNPAAGAHWIRYDSGPQNGNPLIIRGGGFPDTRYYGEAANSFGSLFSTPANNGDGSLSFKVNSGALSGSILIVHGGGLNTSRAYDQNAGSIAGPTLCPVNSGARAAALASGPRNGQNLILCGGNSANYMFYDHPTNTIQTLTSLTGVVGADSSMTQITTGPHAGQYFIVNANATRNTSMFDPAQDSFVGTRMFKAPGVGSNGFVIKSGLKAGRVLMYSGGPTLGTTLYNPQTGLTEQGPNLFASVAAGSTSISITTGANQGNEYIFTAGGSAALQKYNPNTNTIVSAVAGVDYLSAPVIKNAGSRTLLITSGPQANNYLILNGGGSPNADYFNTSTNTFSSAGAVTGCAAISAGSWIFEIKSGMHSGKYMIICGGVLLTSLFDPSTATFSSGPNLIAGTPTTGAHGFTIPSGPDAGKYLFFLGSGNNTRLYNPATNIWGAGPITTPCAGGIQGAGGFAMYIAAGAHAGKALIVLGGDTTTTCYFDPQNSTFALGPDTGPHSGYAVGLESFHFQYGGGIYPTAYFIAHGGASTVFSHWFAY